jgi:hypothetical protein
MNMNMNTFETTQGSEVFTDLTQQTYDTQSQLTQPQVTSGQDQNTENQFQSMEAQTQDCTVQETETQNTQTQETETQETQVTQVTQVTNTQIQGIVFEPEPETKRLSFDTFDLFSKDQVDEFLSTQSLTNLVNALELDVSASTFDRILRELATGWAGFSEETVHDIGYNALKGLLTLDSYPKSVLGPNLEDVLFLTFMTYMTQHPDETTERFYELFSLLRCELVSPTLFVGLREFQQFQDLMIQNHKFCIDLLRNTFFTTAKTRTQKPRHPTCTHSHEFSTTVTSSPTPQSQSQHQSKYLPKFTKKLDPVLISELKTGDRLDVKRENNKWYVGTVLNKTNSNDRVYVSFEGKESDMNEWITAQQLTKDQRLSRLGTMVDLQRYERLKEKKNNRNATKAQAKTQAQATKTQTQATKTRATKTQTTQTQTQKPKPQTQGPVTETDVFKQTLKPVNISQLKAGDCLDIQDRNGFWYTGKVLGHVDGSNSVHVTFDGWSSGYDETITQESCENNPRFSYPGSMTGNKKHTQTPGLKCNGVSCGIIASRMDDRLYDALRSMFAQQYEEGNENHNDYEDSDDYEKSGNEEFYEYDLNDTSAYNTSAYNPSLENTFKYAIPLGLDILSKLFDPTTNGSTPPQSYPNVQPNTSSGSGANSYYQPYAKTGKNETTKQSQKTHQHQVKPIAQSTSTPCTHQQRQEQQTQGQQTQGQGQGIDFLSALMNSIAAMQTHK